MSVVNSRCKALCLWFFTACGGFHIASAAAEQVLYTHSFNMTISVLCEEGEVTCERVEYIGRSLKTGDSIRLQGRTEHTLCADGVSPCRFLGYRFTNGDFVYRVSETGMLQVTQKQKLLLQEQGTWQ